MTLESAEPQVGGPTAAPDGEGVPAISGLDAGQRPNYPSTLARAMAGHHRLLSVPPAVAVSSATVTALPASTSPDAALGPGIAGPSAQMGLPATAGPTGLAVWLLVTTVIGLGLGLHVYRDALSRNVSYPRGWGTLTGALLVGAVLPGVVCYLVYRVFRGRMSPSRPCHTGPDRGHS